MKYMLAVVLPTLVFLSLPAQAAPHAPRVAPSFTLAARSGTVSLDSLRGKAVLVDFWASWCVPCRGSFPWMRGLHERYTDKGLAIVAIDLDKDREAADRFLEQYPAPFTVAFDPSGHTAEAYRVAAMPTMFLVARDGTILHTHTGFDLKKTAEVENLIREACKP